MMELTAINVHDVMEYCEDRDPFGLRPVWADDAGPLVWVDGIVNRFRLSGNRLEEKRADIEAMLRQLPPQFMVAGGGGWSFLQACLRADSVHWGEHPDMERLFALGLGIGVVVEPLPREIWNALPGSMPYYVINLEA